jgi:hypothetical protein
MDTTDSQRPADSAAAHGSAFIALSNDIRHDSPLAWMVFCHSGEHDYMIFTYRQDADDYADEQAEKAELPEGKTWPVYQLWGADDGVMPNEALTGGGGAREL